MKYSKKNSGMQSPFFNDKTFSLKGTIEFKRKKLKQ